MLSSSTDSHYHFQQLLHRCKIDPICTEPAETFSRPVILALVALACAIIIPLRFPRLFFSASLNSIVKIGSKVSVPSAAARRSIGMAWRSSGASNEALIENMSNNGIIHSPRVRQAMLSVDRAHYAPSSPYQDSPQSIGHRATISAPHMHASACESLLPFLEPGSRVLDIGSGSGYLTHVLAELVKPGGKVVGIEHIQPLVDMGIENTRKSDEGRELMDHGGIKYIKADGRLGWPESAPYDAIHVGAAAAGFHQELIDQLKAPGRLFMPVEEDFVQHIYVIDKKEDGSVTKKREYGVKYVPLTDAPKV